MEALASVASDVARASTTALQVAADELAKQANSVAQLAASSDPLAWISEQQDADHAAQEYRPLPPLIPTPLAVVDTWGSTSSWCGGSESTSVRFRPSATGQAGLAGHSADEKKSDRQKPPFDLDVQLNRKIALFDGDLCTLDVDAIIVPTAANFSVGSSTVFERVLRHGGAELRRELQGLDSCRSGESRTADAHRLPCRRLLLTVGPKYREKYLVAAQNTLNTCYRQCFQLAQEGKLRTLAIPCLWYNQGFPWEDHAHVALRSIRRCMEHLRDSFDLVVLVSCGSSRALDLYEGILPLYFPRNRAEMEIGAASLSDCCWSAWGDIAMEERKIRVASHLHDKSTCDDGAEPLFTACDEDDRAFMNAKADADNSARKRLDCTIAEADDPEMAKQVCMRYFRLASELKPEREGSRFVYVVPGHDLFGRRVVVLLGARFPHLGVRDQRAVALFVKEVEQLRGDRFALLYANSGVDSPDMELLQEFLAVISIRYNGSFEELFVLHSGIWFRAAFAVGRAVSDWAANAWRHTTYVDSCAELSKYFLPDQLQLPEFVQAGDPQ